MQSNFATFKVDGYEISATFAEHRNTAICGHMKQILLASFASNAKGTSSGDSLAVPSEQRYNIDGGRRYVP